MFIRDFFQQERPVFSFEFFPPKTEEGLKSLYGTISELAALNPSFVSVTYGAGGSTRDLTVDLTARIKREIGLEAMAHLTCVGHSSAEIAAVVDRLLAAEVHNVLALRGDPPKGQEQFTRPEDGFGYAQELARFLRSRHGQELCIAGACYPEGHVECASRDEDLEHLKAKSASGVDFLVTQLFFDPADYFEFVERARAAGVTQPIVPGIMPVTNVTQLERFTRMCGTRIPEALRERLERVRDDEQAVISAGIEWATDQCRTLLEGGAPGIHFYTLNRSLSTRMVYLNLQG
ncbi:MAG: 5,10-methylenetetrahydrofolate reductase [Armatimonadetes bacterium]|jgi:methylenetetrahydrofolate reductase (NADPH)|nr:5,10-methylenetetrahydrofolate reductase [Armatimonadota bacterium]